MVLLIAHRRLTVHVAVCRHTVCQLTVEIKPAAFWSNNGLSCCARGMIYCIKHIHKSIKLNLTWAAEQLQFFHSWGSPCFFMQINKGSVIKGLNMEYDWMKVPLLRSQNSISLVETTNTPCHSYNGKLSCFFFHILFACSCPCFKIKC